jgi:hypothetical protein
MFIGKRCTERTIRRWVETGRIPNHGTKRQIIVWSDDLINMFDSPRSDLTDHQMSASI